MITICIEEIQQALLGYLRKVEAGETVIILRADKPVAEIKPVTPHDKVLRPFGLCAGEFTVPDDFDTPLPEDLLPPVRGFMKLLLDAHVFLWFISGDAPITCTSTGRCMETRSPRRRP